MADRKIEIPGGGKLNVRIDGKEGAPWVTLSNSLATTIALWDDFVPAIADRYRILRYDQRGHGGSDTPPGPYPITRLGQDIVALWDALGDPTALDDAAIESSALFAKIRQTQVAYEAPLLVAALQGFADGRLHVDRTRIVDLEGDDAPPLDLTADVEARMRP